jgi:hypothetical protein
MGVSAPGTWHRALMAAHEAGARPRPSSLHSASASWVPMRFSTPVANKAKRQLVAVEREYGGPDWHWWTDATTYLVLAVPLIPALIGGWLVHRARRGKNR